MIVDLHDTRHWTVCIPLRDNDQYESTGSAWTESVVRGEYASEKCASKNCRTVWPISESSCVYRGCLGLCFSELVLDSWGPAEWDVSGLVEQDFVLAWWCSCCPTNSYVMRTAQMGFRPITFLWLWPATDHEPHCRHMPVNTIWRWIESTTRSGWWRSHMAGSTLWVTKLLSTTSPITDRFSKFFHC